MKRSLHAATVQFPVATGAVESNLQQARSALQRVQEQGGELAVLPEMWSCGYAYDQLAELAEETARVTELLTEWSALLGLVIVGSLPEKDGPRIYNTAFVHDRGREVGRYRKLHLFSPMQEDRYLTAGDQVLVADTSVGRLGLAICYDLRFPELFRKLALNGAEVVCLPAEWPAPRQLHWQTLLRARAIENQFFVVAANCCGRNGRLRFFGMSLIISPRGDILAQEGEAGGEAAAILDLTDMEIYRREIPAWNDRRPEIYGNLL